jgi:hypothetical protein
MWNQPAGPKISVANPAALVTKYMREEEYVFLR